MKVPEEADGDVLVVGAGLSGLACARDLGRRGPSCSVLDKGRGPGGRLSTRRRTDGHGRAVAFDHGASYFTVRDEDFAREVEVWRRRGVAEPWKARIVTLEAGRVGAPRGEVERYVGTPAMQALAVDMAEQVAACERSRLEFGVRVDALRATGDGVVAHAGERTFGPFRAVCLSAPAPQTATLLEGLGPEARELADVVRAVAMEPSLAALVRFDDRPTAPDGAPFDGAFVDDADLSWASRNASKPGRPPGECWVLHATPAFARRRWDDPPEAWSRDLVAAFERSLGRALPGCDWTDTHRWGFALAPEPLQEGAVSAPVGPTTVAVAGDWCSGSRVEGAWTSGRAAARLLVEAGILDGD